MPKRILRLRKIEEFAPRDSCKGAEWPTEYEFRKFIFINVNLSLFPKVIYKCIYNKKINLGR